MLDFHFHPLHKIRICLCIIRINKNKRGCHILRLVVFFILNLVLTLIKKTICKLNTNIRSMELDDDIIVILHMHVHYFIIIVISSTTAIHFRGIRKLLRITEKRSFFNMVDAIIKRYIVLTSTVILLWHKVSNL